MLFVDDFVPTNAYHQSMFFERKQRLLYIVALALFSSIDLAAIWAQSSPENFDVTRRSVVFIYARDAQGKERPDGTGFLLSVPSKSQPNHGYIILVTARHMADPGWISCPSTGELIAKFNKKKFDPQKDDVGTVDWPLQGQQWITPDDDSVDLAFTFLDGAKFESLNVENGAINLSNLPSASESNAVHIGDEVVSAGLLVTSRGADNLEDALSQKRNYPIFKFGNISSIPDEKLKVPGCQNTIRLMTEWMVAANLVPGNSGSPLVFTPAMLRPGRPFILGVQSVSFIGSDVAGMAPIRYLIEKLRKLNLADADLSKPADAAPAPVTPTNIPATFPAKPGPLPDQKP